MRTFLIFLGLFALAAVISGLLTYPAWVLVHRVADVPIHRVMERIGMLILGIATIVFLRRRGIADRATLGYGIPRAQFIRQMCIGLAAGLILMLALTGLLFGLRMVTLTQEFVDANRPAATIANLLAHGLVAGFATAFIEETFCRGALFSAIKRESGLAAAIILPALLYAASHFIDGRLRIPADQVTYWSGLQVTATLFQRFATPLVYIDAFCALAMLGVLLALVRLRTGAIAGGVGLHAGGASVIWVLSAIAQPNQHSPLLWMTGSYRGVIGWLAFAWIAVVALAYWRLSRNSADANGAG